MKKIAFILTIIAITFASCSSFKPADKPTSQKPTAWEYKVVKIADKDVLTQNTTINTLSLEGWELINTYTEISTSIGRSGYSEYINVHTTNINFIFKRALSSLSTTQPAE
jgi:hypothetical protein